MILKDLLKLKENNDSKNQSGDETPDLHWNLPMPGSFGSIVVLEGGKGVQMIADILDIDDNWKMKKLGDGYVAFDGQRLTFFTHQRDFVDEDGPEDDDADVDELIDNDSEDPAVKARADRMKAINAKKKTAAEAAAAAQKAERLKRLGK